MFRVKPEGAGFTIIRALQGGFALEPESGKACPEGLT
jgi:hypothetical protein